MTKNVFNRHAQPILRRDRRLIIPKGGANGVIIFQGGLSGGSSLYVKDGKPKLVYNWLAREKYYIEGKEALPECKVTLVYDFTYDGGDLHTGGAGRLSINGRRIGEGRIQKCWVLSGRLLARRPTSAWRPNNSIFNYYALL